MQVLAHWVSEDAVVEIISGPTHRWTCHIARPDSTWPEWLVQLGVALGYLPWWLDENNWADAARWTPGQADVT